MPVRRLRQILSSLTLILATLAIVFFLQQLQKQKSQRQIAAEITRLCQLPDLPDSLTIRHASIDHSEQRSYADVILALSGPPKALDEWLEKVDEWEQGRPGLIQNHRIREAEMSSRADFTAEVFLKD